MKYIAKKNSVQFSFVLFIISRVRRSTNKQSRFNKISWVLMLPMQVSSDKTHFTRRQDQLKQSRDVIHSNGSKVTLDLPLVK
jgi:hypothetical protein